MVHHHLRQQQQQQQKLLKIDEEAQLYGEHAGQKKPSKRHLHLLVLLSSTFSLLLLLAALRLLSLHSNDGAGKLDAQGRRLPPCSAVENNTMCCDRSSSFRTDVCVMRGDVRTSSSSKSIYLHGSRMGKGKKAAAVVVEKVRPYTRKWEASLMATVDEVELVATAEPAAAECDVRHNVSAVVFSTGGYTGNVYHEFNDGLIPLFLTAGHLRKQVVFVVLEYHDWWYSKYSDVLSQLSDHPIIDFANDKRTHCFPEAIVGLRIHDELSIDPSKTIAPNSPTILDFRRLLDRAYAPRIRFLEREEAKAEAVANSTEGEEAPEPSLIERPRLLIMSREGSRGIDNENELVALCEEIGFQVKVIRPDRRTELAKIYREMNASDAMIGVHGAAMTHLLFMRPKAAFVQVIPLGTEWAADAYYGEPARKMGLKYIPYKILPKESSLYNKYPKDDPVLRDPESVTAKGWKVTKEIYLDSQSVRLDLNRFLKRLTRVYEYTVSRRNRMEVKWDWSWQLPPEDREREGGFGKHGEV